MNYLTKGEFLQALKDYHYMAESLQCECDKLQMLKYLRYEKVKSPLDYDIVGYKNGEPIREIKGRSYASPEQTMERNEDLDQQIAISNERVKVLAHKLKSASDELHSFPSEFQKILYDKYVDGITFKKIITKYSLRYDEAGLYKYIHRTLDRRYKREAPRQ